MRDHMKLNAIVMVPITEESYEKIEAAMKKLPGADVGPATWEHFMPKREEYDGYGNVGVPVQIRVIQHYMGEYTYAASVLYGEQEDGGTQTFEDPLDAILDGVRYFMGFEDYLDIPNAKAMVEEEA